MATGTIQMETKADLTSSSHTVAGYYVRRGRLITVTGSYVAKSDSYDDVVLNIPNVPYQTAIPARNATTGALLTIWIGANTLSSYGRIGTIATGDKVQFTFTYAKRW